MVREITKDLGILTQKSSRAYKSDLHIVRDLLDTADAHKEECVGLAAIQICEPRRIIVAQLHDHPSFTVMVTRLF
jgi:peptide deformylase